MELSTPKPRTFSALGFTLKREISVSTLLQLTAMLLSALWFADRFEIRQETIVSEMRSIRAQIDRMEAREERIEKYLSSKDPHYWQTIAELSKTDR